MLTSLSGKHAEPYLDGVRGLAALMVLAHHAILYVDAPFLSLRARTSLDYGFHGVSLFFIVSAFTLTRSWALRKTEEPHPTRAFYLRRAFRILPFWWLNVALIQWQYPREFLPLVANLFMFFSFFPFDNRFLMVPYGWSIGIEETFYALFPLWMVFCSNIYRLLGGLLFFIIASVLWYKNAPLLFSHVTNFEYYFTFPLARYYCFFVGIFVYKVSVSARYRNLANLLPRPCLWGCELLISLLLMQLQVLNDLQATFLMGALLLISSNPQGLFYRILPFRVFSQIGICCYSFYLLHFYVLENLKYLKPFIHEHLKISSGETEFMILFTLSAFATYLVSAASFVLIERNSVLLGKFFLQKLRRV